MFGGNMEAAVELLAKEFQTPEIEDVFPTQGGMMQAAMIQRAAQQAMMGAAPAPAAAPRPTAGNRPIDQARSDLAPTVPM
jgi:hypothetical protein